MATLFSPIQDQEFSPGHRQELEPDLEWKKKTKEQIEAGLQELVSKAREDKDQKIRAHSGDNATKEWILKEYNEIMTNLRGIAAEQFAEALQRERQERRWAAGATLSDGWSEALVKEQQAIWAALQREKRGSEAQRDVEDPGSSSAEGSATVGAMPPATASTRRSRTRREDSREPTQSSTPPHREGGTNDEIRESYPRAEHHVPSGSTRQHHPPPPPVVDDELTEDEDEIPLSPPPATGYRPVSGTQSGYLSNSRKANPDSWPPNRPPNRMPMSRTFAHATSPSVSPISPFSSNGSLDDSTSGLSRTSSLRTHATTPDPADVSSGLGRDRAGSGSWKEQGVPIPRTSAKGKQPERLPMYGPRSTASNSDFGTAPVTEHIPHAIPSRFPGPRFGSHLYDQPDGRRLDDDPYADDDADEQPEMEGRGIPVPSFSQRWTPQSSPENMRTLHTTIAAANRPIVNKASFTSRDAYFPSPTASPEIRRWHGPQLNSPLSPSDPAAYSSRTGRPLSNQPSFTEGRRLRQASLSPNPGESARVRHPSPLQPPIGRRDSVGQHSLRSNSSRQSRQEFFRLEPDVGDRTRMATYAENLTAIPDEYDSDEEDYGIELSERRFMREADIARIADEAAEHARRTVIEAARREREEQERKAAEVRRQAEEEARRKEQETRLKEEEARRKEEEIKMREEEAKRKELEVQMKEEEARKKEAEARRRETLAKEEARRKEEEARKKEEEARRKEEEARKKEEEAKKKEREIQRKEAEMKKREEELRLREAEVLRREREMRLKTEQEAGNQQDDSWSEAKLKDVHIIKEQEELWRRAQEQSRQSSAGNTSEATRTTDVPHSTASASGSWPHLNRTGSTASSASTASASSASRPSSTASGWSSSSRSSNTSNTNSTSSTSYTSQSSASSRASSTPTPTPTPNANAAQSSAKPAPNVKSSSGAWRTAAPPPSGTSAQSSKSSTASGDKAKLPEEEAWARRHAEQARKQQESFLRMQEEMAKRYESGRTKHLTREDIVKLFEDHERQWPRLQAMEALTWDAFPWPVFKKPDTPEDLTTSAISAYVLSPHHPSDAQKAPKDRIKDHIKRWHPDRFETKLLRKVREDERERVKEGAGLVARNLNELLTQQSQPDVFS